MRSLDFRFFDDSLMPAKPKYSVMVRLLHNIEKENLKLKWIHCEGDELWDTTFMVSIKLWGKKSSKVIITYRGKHYHTLHIPWKDKADINFRKTVNRLKFPEYLNYDERRKWRTEHHKVLRDPNRPKKEWYLKILPDVIIS